MIFSAMFGARVPSRTEQAWKSSLVIVRISPRLTRGSHPTCIGRITTAGVVTNFTDPGIDYQFGIVTGSDGAMWFSDFANDKIGRITTGVIPSMPAAVTVRMPLGPSVAPPGHVLGRHSGPLGRRFWPLSAAPTPSLPG
jgi:hypothetical protein